jgi:hypothetical protein
MDFFSCSGSPFADFNTRYMLPRVTNTKKTIEILGLYITKVAKTTAIAINIDAIDQSIFDTFVFTGLRPAFLNPYKKSLHQSTCRQQLLRN